MVVLHVIMEVLVLHVIMVLVVRVVIMEVVVVHVIMEVLVYIIVGGSVWTCFLHFVRGLEYSHVTNIYVGVNVQLSRH